MKNFKIYYHDAYKCEAVKDGWSWPAFFFHWIWSFVKGLNALGFTIIGISLVLGFVSVFDESGGLTILTTLIGFGINFWLGSEGNNKRGEMLVEKGYIYQETVLASSPEIAILNFQQQGGVGQTEQTASTQSTGGYTSTSTSQTATASTRKSDNRDSSQTGYQKGSLYKKGE